MIFDFFIDRAKKIFKQEFNEKVFRVQLSYFEDINYAEKVVYKKGFEVRNEVIRKGLVDFSLAGLYQIKEGKL